MLATIGFGSDWPVLFSIVFVGDVGLMGFLELVAAVPWPMRTAGVDGFLSVMGSGFLATVAMVAVFGEEGLGTLGFVTNAVLAKTGAFGRAAFSMLPRDFKGLEALEARAGSSTGFLIVHGLYNLFMIEVGLAAMMCFVTGFSIKVELFTRFLVRYVEVLDAMTGFWTVGCFMGMNLLMVAFVTAALREGFCGTKSALGTALMSLLAGLAGAVGVFWFKMVLETWLVKPAKGGRLIGTAAVRDLGGTVVEISGF